MRGQGGAVSARAGRMIRQLRLMRGWSLEQLAERADASSKHVGSVERGEVNVGVDTLADLARALSVNLGDLVADPAGRRTARSALHVMSGEDVAQLEKVADVVERIKASRVRRPRTSGR
jgi:transcriptional regulator with XRE-family HTH domain